MFTPFSSSSHTLTGKSPKHLSFLLKKKKTSSCLNDITVSTSFTSGHSCLDLFNLGDLVVNLLRNHSGPITVRAVMGPYSFIAYLFRLWSLSPSEHFKQMQVKAVYACTYVNINTKKKIFCYESDLMFGCTRV